MFCQVSQLEGVYAVQEPHFWTLCSDVYVGSIKVEVSPKADARYITSQTHNIFTQVGSLSCICFIFGIFFHDYNCSALKCT